MAQTGRVILTEREEMKSQSDELPEWLVRRIKNTQYGFKSAGDGTGYRDGYHAALEWILSLERGKE